MFAFLRVLALAVLAISFTCVRGEYIFGGCGEDVCDVLMQVAYNGEHTHAGIRAKPEGGSLKLLDQGWAKCSWMSYYCANLNVSEIHYVTYDVAGKLPVLTTTGDKIRCYVTYVCGQP
ncbi:uncharacterized protein L969DRAFT_103749 [Mixia osmundae IAM 14324]|uniref:Uncharacterized protein n=1 Tax=Mixia osmundae (strain CBS 9802 / IAM 14324 / JCM 22182 / KY 12970) TaxID=764103 RepID=G7E1C0_MIXOS|nr:uncharacterized protein L969DRAFT_103749 [Mixia osmundae IAM 14324]KEI38733.1 hypothetical protein L969DRAFT_103749 [Mixia osmundae IAM 14324]GAA96630.1 hypothetical protein E5Q_03300 [Mixia osmundae IAM 14324]